MVKVDELEQFESLKVFSRQELNELSSIAKLYIFSKDKKIFEQNTYLENIYLMVQGEISLTFEVNKDIVLILSNIRPGTFFGISSICGVKTAHNAYCSQASEVIVFPVKGLEDIFSKDKNLAYKFHYEMLKFYHKVTQSRTKDILKVLNKKEHTGEILPTIVDFIG